MMAKTAKNCQKWPKRLKQKGKGAASSERVSEQARVSVDNPIALPQGEWASGVNPLGLHKGIGIRMAGSDDPVDIPKGKD